MHRGRVLRLWDFGHRCPNWLSLAEARLLESDPDNAFTVTVRSADVEDHPRESDPGKACTVIVGTASTGAAKIVIVGSGAPGKVTLWLLGKMASNLSITPQTTCEFAPTTLVEVKPKLTRAERHRQGHLYKTRKPHPQPRRDKLPQGKHRTNYR